MQTKNEYALATEKGIKFIKYSKRVYSIIEESYLSDISINSIQEARKGAIYCTSTFTTKVYFIERNSKSVSYFASDSELKQP